MWTENPNKEGPWYMRHAKEEAVSGGLLSAKLLRLLQLRCSPTATSFFHSQKVVLRNTGLLSSAAHAQSSLSNQNDCSRCAATEDCAAVLACAAQPKSGGESVPSRS